MYAMRSEYDIFVQVFNKHNMNYKYKEQLLFSPLRGKLSALQI